MNRKFLKLTALLLAAMMLTLMLTACNGNTDSNNGESGNNATNESGNTNGSTSSTDDSYKDFVYTAAYQTLKMNEDVQSVDRLTYQDGKLYMVAWMVTGTVTEYYDENWNLITDEEKIANGEYAQKISFAFDVKIFFKTVANVFTARGVVEGGTHGK